MSIDFEAVTARRRRVLEEDAPSQESMRPSGIRKSPSTDQKKVRRAMTKGVKKTSADLPAQKEPVMSRAREAQILQAMAVATPAEQARLALELDALRAQRQAALQADRDLDLADTVVRAHLTPVRTHEINTSGTDWLSTVASGSEGDPSLEMKTEAALFFERTSAEVKADREEFAIQAQGAAQMAAGRFGEQMEVARRAFLDHVAHLARTASDEPEDPANPNVEVDVDQSGNAESTVTDYDTEADQEPFLGEDWEDEGDTGVHPEIPGAGDQQPTAARKQAADGTGDFGWPLAADGSLSCPVCGSTDLTETDVPAVGGTVLDPGATEQIICNSCGHKDYGREASLKTAEREDGVIDQYGCVDYHSADCPILTGGNGNGMTAEDYLRNPALLGDDYYDDYRQGSKKTAAARPLYEIAAEVRRDWTNLYFGAVPYLEAMEGLNSIDDRFGEDPARHIVNYFLSNASTWRGETARRVKAELKAMLGRTGSRQAATRKTAISLTNVGIDSDGNGVGTDPSGNRVTFRLSDSDRADLRSILYSDLAINFSGVDITEDEIIREGAKTARTFTNPFAPGSEQYDGWEQHGARSLTPAQEALVAAADAAYDRQDQAWFDAQSTADLLTLWDLVSGYNMYSGIGAWDDEVYEALYSKGHFASRKTAVNDTDITEEQAREFLSAPPGSRPRIYAQGTGIYEGQIIALRSVQNLDQYADNIGRIWLSGTTIQDLVRRASRKTAEVDNDEPQIGDQFTCVKCGQDIEYVGDYRGGSGLVDPGNGWWDRGGNFSCNQGGFHEPYHSARKQAADEDDQNGNAESGLDQVEVGDPGDRPMWGWEQDANAPGTGAADVEGTPTPGQQVDDYPQPDGVEDPDTTVEEKHSAKAAAHSDTCPQCGAHMDDVTVHGDVLRATCDACGWSGSKRRASLNPVTAQFAARVQASLAKEAMPAPADLGVTVGSIFYSSWGYDQTNVNFYEVVALTPASVKVREVGQRVESSTPPQDYVVPVPGQYIGDVMTKRLQASGYGGAAITINTVQTAWLWDGKPKYRTSSGWGH